MYQPATIILKVNDFPVPAQVCANTLWDHIRGWEVIVAVFIIMGAWAATNISRMHYMMMVARIPTYAPPKVEDNKGE